MFRESLRVYYAVFRFRSMCVEGVSVAKDVKQLQIGVETNRKERVDLV